MAPNRKISRAAVLRALSQFQIERGHPPTIEELREVLDLGSTRTVLRYLQELEKGGEIERWSGARGIRLKRAPLTAGATEQVPVLGAAPAGALLDAEENLLGHVGLARPPQEKRRLFLLRVRGDSMNQATVNGRTIDDGDLVLVAQTNDARSGEVVVALIDGQATIKRLSLGPHYAVLKPESDNAKNTPIVVADALSVQGVVIDVIKEGAERIWQ
jgi:repressor LexA